MTQKPLLVLLLKVVLPTINAMLLTSVDRSLQTHHTHLIVILCHYPLYLPT